MEADVNKIIMMLDIVSREYQVGVVSGKVSNEMEYEESLVFLKQAGEKFQKLSPQSMRDPSAGERISAQFSTVTEKTQNLADSAEVRADVEKIKKDLLDGFGVKISQAPKQPVSLEAGKVIYEANCKICHGAAGKGDGPLATQIKPKPANLADPAITGNATTKPYDNFQIINVGIGGTPMLGWAETLSEQDIWNVTYYIRSFSNPELPLDVMAGAATSGASSGASNQAHVDEVFDSTRKQLEISIESLRAGKSDESADQAFDAYLTFESMEAVLLGKNKTLGLKLESAFGRLRAEIKRGAPLQLAESIRSGILNDMKEAEMVLKEQMGFAGLFVQSLAIIVREGFEAILIIAALITFLIKSRNQDRLGTIYKGIGLALVASLATAFLLREILKVTVTSQELLEGWIMLIAMAVLFWVSYWLITKIETQKWQQFITGKVREALTAKNQWTLAFMAFLTVYREGFETVLFYIGLYTSAGNATSGIVPGFLAGCVILAVIYYLIKVFGMQIPVKWFFGVTSVFLYYMAFSFMGKGLHALQMGLQLSATPAPFIPEWPQAGLFPTWETLIGQGILALAYIGALIYTFGIQPEIQSRELQRETGHIHSDISSVLKLVEHISQHAKRCKTFLKDTRDQDLKELSAHLHEIDDKVHELFEHVKQVESRLQDEYERLGLPFTSSNRKIKPE